MAILSLRDLFILQRKKYELQVLQEAAISYRNSSGNYKIAGYTMVVHSTLYKQLCWEFGVNHNCVRIVS